jgi:MFS family permease
VAPACILIGRLTDRLGSRLMILGGLTALVLSVYLFASVNPWTSAGWIITLVIALRVSSEFLFAPLNYTGMRLLPGSAMRMGAGILSLMWSIGGSLGNASTAVALQHRRVIHSLTLGGELHGDGSEREQALVEVRRLLQDAGYTQDDLESASQGFLQHYMNQEMSVAAFQDCFLLVAGVYLFTLLPAFLIRLPKTPDLQPIEFDTNGATSTRELYPQQRPKRAITAP